MEWMTLSTHPIRKSPVATKLPLHRNAENTTTTLMGLRSYNLYIQVAGAVCQGLPFPPDHRALRSRSWPGPRNPAQQVLPGKNCPSVNKCIFWVTKPKIGLKQKRHLFEIHMHVNFTPNRPCSSCISPSERNPLGRNVRPLTLLLYQKKKERTI